MLEPSSVPVYKAIFKIVPAMTKESDFLETIYTVIHRDITMHIGFVPDFRRFCIGMQHKSEDETIMLRTASFRPDAQETSPRQWALSLRSRDRFLRRRTWILQIGLSWQENSAVAFCLALHCSDHQAGSMTVMTPPNIQPPALLQKLLHHPELTCLSGSSCIPASPIHLMAEDFSDFQQCIFDPARTFPVVLITCPDLVSPTALYAKSLGNLIVCWLDDYRSYERLCELLPPELQFPWDAVKIIMPGTSRQTYHPTLSIENITGMGGEAVLEGICRAFCICPTGAERRAFVTVDGLYSLFKERTYTLLRSEHERLQKESERLSHTIQELTANQAQLSAELDACKAQANSSQDSSWEELLNESLQENEKLKKGVSQLTSHLFDDLNIPFFPDESDICPELHDLTVAIRAFRNLMVNHQH